MRIKQGIRDNNTKQEQDKCARRDELGGCCAGANSSDVTENKYSSNCRLQQCCLPLRHLPCNKDKNEEREDDKE